MPYNQVELRIRRCTEADLPALADIARRTFYETFTGTCTDADMQDFLDTFYNETRLGEELRSEGDHTFFAELGGIPIGYLRFQGGPVAFEARGVHKPLELNRLYVDAAFKGKGVAQELMQFYLQFAQENNHDYLWLGVWEHNERAKAFYRRNGFSNTGFRHPFPIGQTPQTDEWWARSITNEGGKS